MRCIDCEDFKFLTDENDVGYGYCLKKGKDVLPFSLCKTTKAEREEMKIIDFYMENYKEKDIKTMAKELKIDKGRLDYLATKHYLPRRTWGGHRKHKQKKKEEIRGI